jgi:hypothetical protein
VAVVVRNGVSNVAGHYWIIIREPATGQWWKIDETSVTRCAGPHIAFGSVSYPTMILGQSEGEFYWARMSMTC